jgi:hypothetical protein
MHHQKTKINFPQHCRRRRQFSCAAHYLIAYCSFFSQHGNEYHILWLTTNDSLAMRFKYQIIFPSTMSFFKKKTENGGCGRHHHFLIIPPRVDYKRAHDL